MRACACACAYAHVCRWVGLKTLLMCMFVSGVCVLACVQVELHGKTRKCVDMYAYECVCVCIRYVYAYMYIGEHMGEIGSCLGMLVSTHVCMLMSMHICKGGAARDELESCV